jgi:hypothetical protein
VDRAIYILSGVIVGFCFTLSEWATLVINWVWLKITAHSLIKLW